MPECRCITYKLIYMLQVILIPGSKGALEARFISRGHQNF